MTTFWKLPPVDADVVVAMLFAFLLGVAFGMLP